MKSSDLLVRSGTSAELIKLILQLRNYAAASLKVQTSYSGARLWVPRLRDFVANSYFIYFEYAQTTLGYAILTYPEKHGRTLHYTAALRDFFVPDDSDNSFTLGAVMLAYIAAHCRTMALASLRLDFRSCEANILLQALLQSLLPEQPLNSTSIVLNDQQLALLANCIDIMPQQFSGKQRPL